MNRVAAWLCATLLALAGCGPAERSGAGADRDGTGASGLAVLAQGAAGFAQARRGAALMFPRDHGSHPDFRIEWWYLTANLEDGAGRPYGAQWTLFRYAAHPPAASDGATGWHSGQVFMAHLALTTPSGHRAFQRYARGGDHGGLRQAGVTAAPFAAWLDDWRLASRGAAWLPLDLQARQGRYAVQLTLDSDRPPVLQGEGGFSQKHPDGGGSHYYSQPFLQARGELVIDGETIAVTGQAWLDREWSSQFLQPDQAGWDWFALHLDSGEKLMLFRLRQQDGAAPFQHGMLIAPDGSTRPLDPAGLAFEALAEESVAGRRLPLQWRIDLGEPGRSLTVAALHPDQWLDLDYPYWEGAVTVTGDGPGSRGVGYLELTGYPTLGPLSD